MHMHLLITSLRTVAAKSSVIEWNVAGNDDRWLENLNLKICRSSRVSSVGTIRSGRTGTRISRHCGRSPRWNKRDWLVTWTNSLRCMPDRLSVTNNYSPILFPDENQLLFNRCTFDQWTLWWPSASSQSGLNTETGSLKNRMPGKVWLEYNYLPFNAIKMDTDHSLVLVMHTHHLFHW